MNLLVVESSKVYYNWKHQLETKFTFQFYDKRHSNEFLLNKLTIVYF